MGFNVSGPVDDAVRRAANELGVDVNLAFAIMMQESGGNPLAVGDNGHSIGLFQLNDNGEGAGMSLAQKQDPYTNAYRALSEVAAVANAHPDWSPGTIAAAAQRPADRAGYARSVDAIYSGNGGQSTATGTGGGGGGGVVSGGGGPVADQAPTAQYKLPAGGWLTTIEGAYPMVTYQITPNLAIAFALSGNVDTSNLSRNPLSLDQWNASKANIIMGGDASSLDSVAKNYPDFDHFFRWILDTHLGANEQAKSDPGVLKVMLQLAARPDMSPDELQNLLKQTDYWKARTSDQLAWNDFSPAEQQKRVADTAAQLTDQWFQLTGQQTPDAGALNFWATQVASGVKGLNEAILSWIKPEAAKIPQSPWSRTLEQEQENERQQGVDVSNQTEAARQLAAKWGVQLSDPTLAKWGSDITTKVKSDADLTGYLRNQAQTMFPWMKQLDPSGEQTTTDLAQPWLQTYSRVMEKPADVLNPDIQKALTNATPAWQFEQDLKKQPAWLQTKNAESDMTSAVGDLGRRMGFN